MVDEQSIVKKTESAVDDLRDLWQRRRLVCIVVVTIIFLPAAFTLYQQFIIVPGLRAEVSTLESQQRDAERSRDKAELQLAPFLAAADRRFPDTPADKRLDLLLERLNLAINDVQNAARKVSPERSISPQLRQSLVTDLKSVPKLDVEISCVLGDTEGFSLASQLRSVFDDAGWKVNGVHQAVYSIPIRGIVFTFGEEPPGDLQRVLVLLFDGLGYPRQAELNKELGKNSLKILVGSK